MRERQSERRSGIKIMAKLIVLLGSLSYIMLLAVLNGSLGFICAMGVTVMGAVGVAKALGETIMLSYTAIAAIAIAFGVLRGGLRYLEQYGNHYIAFKLLAVLRDKVYCALSRLCPAKLETKQKGSLIALISSDIETLEVFYAHTISPVCIAVTVSFSIVLFVSLTAHWYLAMSALLGYCIVGIGIPVCASKKMKGSGVRYREAFSSFNGYFLDSIKGLKETIYHRAEKERMEEVERRSDVLLAQTKQMKKDISFVSAMTEAAVTLCIILTLIIGIVLVNEQTIGIGRMIIGVVTVFSGFGPVIALSALAGNLTQTFAGGERILKLLEEEPVVQPITTGIEMGGFESVHVDDLGFSYEEGDRLLQEISMYAKRGEIVGIVGRSGCGKSTLLKLLMRFWKKSEGKILYNGNDIETILSDNLLDNVTLVNQMPYLFDESIEYNLKIAKADATMEEMEQACKKASIHDFISSLPQGYQTKAGALGDRLSAGEKQRIALARAFLHNAKLILLDEPTSNVDSVNEGIILRSIAKQKQDRCIVLVSHRESAMAIADRVYRIENGKISEVR